MQKSPEFEVNDAGLRRGYGHMVHRYYLARLEEKKEERKKRLALIDSSSAARQYVKNIRREIAACFGPLTAVAPLNSKTTGILERNGYRIEKVIFDSEPGCPVTANLYLPAGPAGTFPGVIFPCGHSLAGKAAPRYQECCQRLARAGFAVLVYDPINQGERDQYYHLSESEDVRKNCCLAHNMMARQMQLAGDFLGSWFVRDGIRALDYLCSREEVDNSRIGLTGNSGGGTLSGYLWALDDRFTMVAPSCWVTSWSANLKNELPADAEQYPPGALARGLEQVDFIIAGAPGPALIIGQYHDWFDRRSLDEAFHEARKIYRLLEAEKNVNLFIGSHDHGFYPDAQAAMVSFFCAQAGLPEPESGFSPLIEKEEHLRATGTGNVISEGGTPIPTLVAEKCRALHASVITESKEVTRQKLSALLKVDTSSREAPDYRNLMVPEKTSRGWLARFAVETEPGIMVLLRKFVPGEKGDGGCVFNAEEKVDLYLPHSSAEAELRHEPPARELAGNPAAYFVDLRGLGESMPDESGDFFYGYGMDYLFQGHGLMLGESYFGRRVHDLLRVMDLFRAGGTREFNLHGRGQGALVVLFAAALRGDGIKQVQLRHYPESFLELAGQMVTRWPSVNFIHRILEVCDIPELVEMLPGG